jgi:IclR family acetate operon transcriptional repressor
MAEPMTNVLRTLAVCEAVSELQPIGVRELARAIEQPRSSVQRALETLHAAGWLVRTDDGRWSLSLRPAVIGGRAGAAGALVALARPTMEQLRQVSDESVRLWVPDGDRIQLVAHMDSRQPVRSVLQPGGSTMAVHATAAGKAILAFLPPSEVDVLLARPLASLTPHTITDPDELRTQLTTIRARGWAQTSHEATPDVGAVAAPILDPTGRPLAAIALALPMHRLTPAITERHVTHLVAATQALTEELSGTVRP